MGWCPRRRCSGDCGVHQTSIKPASNPGRFRPSVWHRWDHAAGGFASYGTTVAWLWGFGLLGRCIVPTSYRETSVFGPMRSLIILSSRQLSGRRLRMSGVVPWKDMRGSAAAAARRSSLLSDRVRMWRASVFAASVLPTVIEVPETHARATPPRSGDRPCAHPVGYSPADTKNSEQVWRPGDWARSAKRRRRGGFSCGQ